MIVISPHCDDSILSLGGLIISKIKSGEKVKVINVFTRTNYSLLKCDDIDFITIIRKLEELRIQNLLKHEIINLDYFDNCIRNKLDIFQLKNEVESFLNKKEDIYFPLAINNCHKDHKILYDVSIMFDGYNILYYEDMPYTIKYIDKLPKDKKEIIHEIDINTKINLLKNYQSQITNEMLKNIAAYSYSILDDRYYERVWG